MNDFTLTSGWKVVLLMSCLLSVNPVLAEFRDVNGDGVAESWPGSKFTFYTGSLSGADGLWIEAFQEAANRWNDSATDLEIAIVGESATGKCTSAGNNAASFEDDVCGDEFGAGVVAIASTYRNPLLNRITKSDIFFNRAIFYLVYDGDDFGVVDFRRVAVHELGHSMGLAHSAASEDDSIMFPAVGNSFIPQFEEVVLLRAVYGVKTYELTINIEGQGRVAILPKVLGTGVVHNDIFYTSGYSNFLDCGDNFGFVDFKGSCVTTIQEGLRLSLSAISTNGESFLSWDGTQVESAAVLLSPLTRDRTLTANFSGSRPGCANQTINTVYLDGNDYAGGGTVSDTAAGILDICGVFNSDTLAANEDRYVRLDLGVGDDVSTPNPSFDTSIKFTVTNLETKPPVMQGGVSYRSVIFQVRAPANGLLANQTFKFDIDGIRVSNATDIQATVRTYETLTGAVTQGTNFLAKTTATYIDFSIVDGDGDGVDDETDAFPNDSSETKDTDSDGVGDNADTDDDNDGVLDVNDAFPLDSSESVDTDTDGVGNNADTDDDNDGVEDTYDAFPLDATETIDSDGDGVGDVADTDDDNDGVGDIDDAFPLDDSESVDTDSDGIGNNSDTDDDNDGVADIDDAFPLDGSESVDTDSDGIGDNADTDDDNDGVADIDDAFPLDPSVQKIKSRIPAWLLKAAKDKQAEQKAN